MHEPGLERLERGVAEAERLEPAGRLGLDQEIRARDEPPQHVAVARVVEVERDAALAARVGPEGERALRARLVAIERPLAPHRAAAARLHLDHVRAEVGEDLAAQDPAIAGEIDHAVRAQHASTLLFE